MDRNQLTYARLGAALVAFDQELNGKELTLLNRVAAMRAAIDALDNLESTMTCEARQYSDQMLCPCGLGWDVNDPEPPTCRRQRHVEPGKPVPPIVREAWKMTDGPDAPPIAVTFTRSVTATIPESLPVDVLQAMSKAHDAAGGKLDGMRAAYRVFLDSLP